MSRMLQQYVKEEEMRAKHQTALLQLREKAIKEKTQAELEWLNIKKRYVLYNGKFSRYKIFANATKKSIS